MLRALAMRLQVLGMLVFAFGDLDELDSQARGPTECEVETHIGVVGAPRGPRPPSLEIGPEVDPEHSLVAFLGHLNVPNNDAEVVRGELRGWSAHMTSRIGRSERARFASSGQAPPNGHHRPACAPASAR